MGKRTEMEVRKKNFVKKDEELGLKGVHLEWKRGRVDGERWVKFFDEKLRICEGIEEKGKILRNLEGIWSELGEKWKKFDSWL